MQEYKNINWEIKRLLSNITKEKTKLKKKIQFLKKFKKLRISLSLLLIME